MKDVLAAIDLGTTSVRCCLFDTTGTLHVSAGQEYPTSYPFPGAVEQDLNQMVEVTFEVCREAVRKAGGDPHQIRAISFSAQRACFCPVDSEGKLVRPMISWQDTRTSDQVAEMATVVGNEEFSHRAGLPLSTVILLSKWLWLQEHEPEAARRVHRIVQCQDVLLHAFGVDRWLTDMSCAAFYGLWNVREKRWDSTLLERFGLEEELFGVPTESGQVVGSVSRAIAEKSGFAEGTPICIGAGDQNCSVLGMGGVDSGLVTITLGTAGLCILSTEQARQDVPGMFCTNHIQSGLWNLEGLSNAAASSLRWYRDTFLSDLLTAADSGGSVWSRLESEAVQSPAGSRGVLFLPYLAAAATPHWNSSARGCLLGLALSTTQGDIIRAIMEGVVFEINEMLQSWRDCRIPIGTVRVGGGATKSRLWNRIQADIYGNPVEIVCEQETAALGAAVLAGFGAGLFSSVAEGVAAMVHVRDVIDPDPANRELYRDRFELFSQSYRSLQSGGVFERLVHSARP